MVGGIVVFAVVGNGEDVSGKVVFVPAVVVGGVTVVFLVVGGGEEVSCGVFGGITVVFFVVGGGEDVSCGVVGGGVVVGGTVVTVVELAVLDETERIITLNAPIETKVVCFSRLLKCLRSLYGKQCGPRSDCSYRSSLFWVHAVRFDT